MPGRLTSFIPSSVCRVLGSGPTSASCASRITGGRFRSARRVAAMATTRDAPARWSRLGTPRSELALEFTLPTGQTFRWRQTGADEFTGVMGQRVVRMRQLEDDIEYTVLARGPDAPEDGDRAALEDYFNLHHRVGPMAAGWARADERFREVSPHFPGVRMLRQDPLETLFAFICSQNNHITRIHGLVEKLCSVYGTPLLAAAEEEPTVASPAVSARSDGADAPGTPGPSQPLEEPAAWSPAAGGARRGKVASMIENLGFYAFPTCEQLSAATEEALRRVCALFSISSCSARRDLGGVITDPGARGVVPQGGGLRLPRQVRSAVLRGAVQEGSRGRGVAAVAQGRPVRRGEGRAHRAPRCGPQGGGVHLPLCARQARRHPCRHPRLAAGGASLRPGARR